MNTYENKHKEEIIRATQLWECGDITRENLEYIFPELKESEGEKIRKALIKFHKSTIDIDGIRGDEIVSWLEKQGEPLNESVYDTEDKEIYQAISIGLTDVFNEYGWSDFGGIPIENIQKWLENQGKQKPAKWSEEDEKITLSIEHVMNCASLLNIVPEKVDKIRTWIKSLKQRMEVKV